jgi:L-ascorbate metabolism protein UlaG (beta-lactamase superfamily)
MTISHYHEDHTAGMNEVGGNPKIIYPENLNKTINIGAVEITGHPAAHILNMGDNTIFVYKIGKLKIVHMVEAESVDSPETLTAIKDADVILVYTGELGKLKGRDIYNFTKQINARIVIPQHYSINPKYLFYGEPTAELNKIVLLDIVGISVKTTALSGMDKKLKIY